MDMIETKALEFAYPAEEGEKPVLALRGVDTAIEKGSFVVVLGHNGSGKSTFAKSLNAILLPCGGKVYVEGMDTQDEACLLEIRRRVGMVFQNPDNQIVANVVEEDVAFAPENLGVASEEIRRRVDDALAAVDMTAFMTHAPHLLSGGQKQRIAIAGVIAMEPECIVLDEATAMLDPIGRQEVLSAVHKLNREKGITVVLITHHMNEAEEADRVIVMDDGQHRAGRHPQGGLYPSGAAADHGPDGARHGGLAGPSAEGRAGRTPGRFNGGRMCGCHYCGSGEELTEDRRIGTDSTGKRPDTYLWRRNAVPAQCRGAHEL